MIPWVGTNKNVARHSLWIDWEKGRCRRGRARYTKKIILQGRRPVCTPVIDNDDDDDDGDFSLYSTPVQRR